MLTLVRAHDLPVSWDGAPVRWRPWSDARSTLAYHASDEELIEQAALAPIRAALDGHPACDVHPDDDPVSCGWKRAVADVRRALDA